LFPRHKITFINKSNNPFLINLQKEINNCHNNKIKKYLLKFDIDILYIYYYKIIFNAFDMYKTPVLLFNGATMNHSCFPNIYFYECNNAMIFITLSNIKKGDELTYSYLRHVNYKTNEEKHKYLLNHYNFECNCI
jgi:SET domain-containing protein